MEMSHEILTIFFKETPAEDAPLYKEEF